ncbi:MAG: hypothetical protein ACRDTP_12500, partial [Mycobacteriales bacterium]
SMSADYFDRLEDELRAAVSRVAAWPEVGHGAADTSADASANGSAGRTRRLLRRVPLAPIGLAVAVAVAVVVVVGAVALLGHRPNATTGPGHPSGPPPSTASAYPTLRQLKDNFAILRRPQTAADRSWRPNYGDNPPQTLPGLARLARRLADGDRVFLTVQHDPPTAGYELFAWMVYRDGDTNGYGFGPPSYGLLPLPTSVGVDTTRWTSIVPDAVNQVIWTFGCPRATASCRRLVRSVRPAKNIATAAIPGTSSCTAGTCREVIAASWYATDGGVVAHWSLREHTRLTAPPFDAPKPPPALWPEHQVVLGNHEIFDVHFGQPLAALVRRVRPMLGAPKISHGTPMCGVDGMAVWPASRAGEQLQVTTRRSRIVGYQYGAADGPSKPRGRSLATTRGLAIGDTLARGRALYGRRFRISNAQGGTWSVGTGYYGLRGYAWANRTDSVPVGLHSPVSSIAAGDVGCPALSP